MYTNLVGLQSLLSTTHVPSSGSTEYLFQRLTEVPILRLSAVTNHTIDFFFTKTEQVLIK